MGFFSSLMPGLREIRAPLVAGYLWLLCAWLLLEPAAPSPDGNQIYERLFELGEAVGPLGWAVAASVSAYLVGSLIQAVMRLGQTGRVRGLSLSSLDEKKYLVFEQLESDQNFADVELVIPIASPSPDQGSPSRLLFDSGSTVTASIAEIADRELSDSFRRLQVAVRRVQSEFRSAARCEFGMHERTPIVRIPIETDTGKVTVEEFEIPHLLASRDLLAQIPLLQTRLLEVAEATGGQVERLRAEAEFRLTLAVPLVVLTGIFAIGVSFAWVLALALPAALAVQGYSLYQRALEELVDALRARAQTPELEQITPVFARYRSFATQLIDGLRMAHWDR